MSRRTRQLITPIEEPKETQTIFNTLEPGEAEKESVVETVARVFEQAAQEAIPKFVGIREYVFKDDVMNSPVIVTCIKVEQGQMKGYPIFIESMNSKTIREQVEIQCKAIFDTEEEALIAHQLICEGKEPQAKKAPKVEEPKKEQPEVK